MSCNDLVQFHQWSALDMMPVLKRLNLSSNRIRHLNDDDEACQRAMFINLTDFNLSNNEITLNLGGRAPTEFDDETVAQKLHNELSQLQYFPNLENVNLTDNPAAKQLSQRQREERTCSGREVFFMQFHHFEVIWSPPENPLSKVKMSFNAVTPKRVKEEQNRLLHSALENVANYRQNSFQVPEPPRIQLTNGRENAARIEEETVLRLQQEELEKMKRRAIAAADPNTASNEPPDVLETDLDDAGLTKMFERIREQVDEAAEEFISDIPETYMRPIPYRSLQEKFAVIHAEEMLMTNPGALMFAKI